MSDHRRKLEALAAKRSSRQDADPEADVFGDDARIRKAEPRGVTAPQKRSKMRGEAEMREMLSDPKYGGAVVARSKFQTQTSSDEESSEDAASEELSADEEDAEVSASEGSDGDEGSSEEEFDGGSGEDDGDEDEEQMDAGGSSAAAGLAADLDAELLALEQGDSQALIASARQTQDEAAQGVRVRQQLASVSLALETRVRLQTALVGAARLPGPAAHRALCAASKPLASAFRGLRAELAGLLRDLLSLQCASIAADADAATAVCATLRIPSSAAAAASGRKRRRPVNADAAAGRDDDDDEAASGAGSRSAAATAAAIAEATLPTSVRNAATPAAKRMRTAGGATEDAGSGSGSVGVGVGGAASAEELWAGVSGLSAAYAPFRDSTVNAWSRRLAFSSGVNARQASKLRVLTSDLSAQVEDLLRTDMPRLVARTQPKAAAVQTLGERRAGAAAGAAAGAGAAAADAGAEEGGATLPHVYDDSDFYSALLRDLLASSSLTAGGAAAGGSSALPAGLSATGAAAATSLAALLGGDAGAAAALLLKHKSVKRQGIDRRATKGRRLKYTPLPKLVGFMAPAPYVVPPDRAFDLDTLTASLFQSSA